MDNYFAVDDLLMMDGHHRARSPGGSGRLYSEETNMKKVLLSIFALAVLATSFSSAEAQHRRRHCWYSHHHRHCSYR
jgi:hypothetical protein